MIFLYLQNVSWEGFSYDINNIYFERACVMRILNLVINFLLLSYQVKTVKDFTTCAELLNYYN